MPLLLPRQKLLDIFAGQRNPITLMPTHQVQSPSVGATGKGHQLVVALCVLCGLVALLGHLYALIIAFQAYRFLQAHPTDMPMEIYDEIFGVSLVIFSLSAALCLRFSLRRLADPQRAWMWTLLALAITPPTAFLVGILSGYGVWFGSVLAVFTVPMGAMIPSLLCGALSKASRGRGTEQPLSRQEVGAFLVPILPPLLGLGLLFGVPAYIEYRDPPRLILKQENLNDVEFAPKGDFIATNDGISDQPGGVTVWNARSGQRLWRKSFRFAVYRLSFTPDGNRLVSECYDSKIRVWDTKNGRLLRSFALPERFSFLQLTKDGRTLLTASGFQVWFYDVASGRLQRKVRLPEKPAPGGADETSAFPGYTTLSPDGRLLAGVMAEMTIRLWDARSGRKRRTLFDTASHKLHAIQQIEFSPDGKWLASAEGAGRKSGHGTDEETMGRVRLWDTRSWRQRKVLVDGDWVHRIGFSRDGRHFYTESGDGTALWDVKTWHVYKRLHRASDSSGFSADNRSFASSDRDSVRLWDSGSTQSNHR
jgi:hypothetical protein